QIDGSAFSLVQDGFGITEGEPVKADDALPRRLVELAASPQRVPDPSRVGIEADIPGEIDIGRLDQRLDLALDRQKMRDPPLDHLAERVEPAPSGGKIERHVEKIAALPIAFGIAIIEHVDLARNRQAEHGNEWRG